MELPAGNHNLVGKQVIGLIVILFLGDHIVPFHFPLGIEGT